MAILLQLLSIGLGIKELVGILRIGHLNLDHPSLKEINTIREKIN